MQESPCLQAPEYVCQQTNLQRARGQPASYQHDEFQIHTADTREDSRPLPPRLLLAEHLGSHLLMAEIRRVSHEPQPCHEETWLSWPFPCENA